MAIITAENAPCSEAAIVARWIVVRKRLDAKIPCRNARDRGS
jgi:hypothetical protein